MRLTRAATSAITALVLTLTACSDDGGLDPEAEEELLEGALLTLDDLPEGFEEGEPSEEGGNEAIEECGDDADIDEDALEDATVAEAGPVAFVLEEEGTFGEIEATLRTIDPTDPAETVFEAMAEDDFRECVLEAFEESAEDDGQTVEDAEIDEGDPPVDGDAAGGLEFSGDISGFEFEGQVVAVIRENHLISLEVTSLEGAIDDDVVEEAFEAMIERLEAED